jgi:tetratricopeptide (TPR) repeat protein
MLHPTQALHRIAVIAALFAPAIAQAHGAFHERLAQLAAIIERSPGEARAHFELAELFCRHGDWALAIGAADTVDELKPNNFPTDLVRGEALLGLGHAIGARRALDRFLASQPGQARARVLRARATAAIEGPSAALEDYRAALRCPGPPSADHVREAAAALVAGGCRDEAIDALARAIDLLGPEPALLHEALALEEASSRVDAALTRIAALETGAPRREPWMARRARVLTAAQRHPAARLAWRDLLRHLDALPNLERGLPGLRLLADEARAALTALDSSASAQ